jgi:ATP-dependent Clp protease ATP-binding subunit ClpB
VDFSKFTEKAQTAVSEAQNAAVRHNHQSVDAEHLLLALLQQENGLVPRLLEKAGISAASLTGRVEQALAKIPAVPAPGPPTSPKG